MYILRSDADLISVFLFYFILFSFCTLMKLTFIWFLALLLLLSWCAFYYIRFVYMYRANELDCDKETFVLLANWFGWIYFTWFCLFIYSFFRFKILMNLKMILCLLFICCVSLFLCDFDSMILILSSHRKNLFVSVLSDVW